MTTTVKILQVPLGVSRSYQLTLTDDSGDVITTYTSSAWTPTCEVWAGDDQAAWSTAPTVAWATDGSDGLVNVTVTSASTSGHDPQTYRLRILLTQTSGDPVEAWDGRLQVLPAPGSAAVPQMYCTYDDLLDLWDNLEDFSNDHDLAGFDNQIAKATSWLNRVILAHDRGATYVVITATGYSPVGTYGGLGANVTNKWLKDKLDANFLMVTPVTVEIVANRALGLILQRAVGTDKEESSYERHARCFIARANELVKTYIAELDLAPQDGYPDYWVDCGTSSQRRS